MSEKSISGSMPLREQVEPQRHQVDVAGPLSVAEQRPLDPVGAGHVAQLGGRHSRAPVVVRVQREHDRVAVRQIAGHPLDRVGVHVGRRHLDRRRQVDDRLAVGGRLPHVVDRVADLDRIVELGAGVGLRRVLEPYVRPGHGLRQLEAQPRSVHRDRGDALPVESEHDAALQGRRRVVEVHDDLVATTDRLVRPLDQLGPGLREDLDRHVIGDQVLLDELTHEVEVGLRRRREADLDLLVAHADQQVEHPPLAGRRHGVDQGLVAVPQVDAAPGRRAFEAYLGPPAVGQRNRREGRVLVDRHAARRLRRAMNR